MMYVVKISLQDYCLEKGNITRKDFLETKQKPRPYNAIENNAIVINKTIEAPHY